MKAGELPEAFFPEFYETLNLCFFYPGNFLHGTQAGPGPCALCQTQRPLQRLAPPGGGAGPSAGACFNPAAVPGLAAGK